MSWRNPAVALVFLAALPAVTLAQEFSATSDQPNVALVQRAFDRWATGGGFFDEISATNTRTEIVALLHDQFARLTRQLRLIELPHGITPERLSALSVIAKRPISVTALADYEKVCPATMSRMVAALGEEDLVKRAEDKTDGRSVLVSATPKGRRAYQRAHEQRLQQFADALHSLSNEQLEAMRGRSSASPACSIAPRTASPRQPRTLNARQTQGA
jgi:DNA-binding MarR family transcriptional regulator